MGIHGNKSTPRQELIGRAAMIVGGIVMGLAGVGLGYFCIKAGTSLGEAGAGSIAQYCWPLLVLAAFLVLVALVFIVFAILPDRETPLGPPRGFVLVSRVFDGFWSVVGALTGWSDWMD